MAGRNVFFVKNPRVLATATLPEYLTQRSWPLAVSDESAVSKFHEAGGRMSRLASLNPSIANALFELCGGEGPCRMSIIKVGAHKYSVEMPYLDMNGVPTGSYFLASLETVNGVIEAAKYTPPVTAGNTVGAVSVPTNGTYSPVPAFTEAFFRDHPAAAIYALLIVGTLNSGRPECADMQVQFDSCRTCLEGSLIPGNPNAFNIMNAFLPAYYISDAVEWAMNKEIVNAYVPGSKFEVLQEAAVEANGGTLLYGPRPVVLKVTDASAPSIVSMEAKDKVYTVAEAKAMFANWRAKQNWTEEDRVFIPVFDDDYPVPPETIKIARRYIMTSGSRRPMRNMMWRGVTAYGKSTGVEILAAILDMPLLRMTCSSNMETQQFLTDFVPDTSTQDLQYMGELPTFMEIANDPSSAYYKLTNVYDPDISCEDVLKASMQAVAERERSSSARFKHVESNYVKALSRGYICEIQELSRIKDPGVLVGLNEFDRPGSIIPMLDGSYKKRHPDALVVATDNVGYASCRAMDPSVMRRFSFVIDSYDLPEETVLARVKYNTGFTDDTLLKGMYDLWKAIEKHCRETDIVEGSVSVSELEMWASAAKFDAGTGPITSEILKETCIECVVAKATSDRAEQDSIKAFVLGITGLFQ